MSKFLLIAPLAMLLTACSRTVSVMPMPLPPANLAKSCPLVPMPPKPLVDPERLMWEIDVMTKYTDCAIKHDQLVEAWTNAVNAGKK